MTDRPLSLVHVVPRINEGGPVASLLAEHRAATASGPVQILALEQSGSTRQLAALLRQRIRVKVGLPPDAEAALLQSADVVVLHYWNTPSVWSFLDRWRDQALHWVLVSRINGLHPPQRLPAWLAAAPNHLVLTHPALAGLRGDTMVSVVGGLIESAEPRPSDRTGGIVHIGTTNVFKLDPAFVDLHIGVDLHVVAAGSGGDEDRFRARAVDLGVADRVSFPGFVSDPTDLLGTARVFAAPTARFTYGSSDKAVQLAQAHGVPVLTYADSPIAHLVEPGVSGWLARDRGHYRELLDEALHREPDGSGLADPESVAAWARAAHDPSYKARGLVQVYEQAADGPPRPPGDGLPDLADWVADQAGPRPTDPARPDLDTLIGDDQALADHQRWACEGGWAQYLNTFPELR